jgi:hypothetical protein
MPSPVAKQVFVKVTAASVNLTDWELWGPETRPWALTRDYAKPPQALKATSEVPQAALKARCELGLLMPLPKTSDVFAAPGPSVAHHSVTTAESASDRVADPSGHVGDRSGISGRNIDEI